MQKVDKIHISTLKEGVRTVKGVVTLHHFIDNETKQHVYYVPSFELTGYGKSAAKAHEMLKISLNEYFNYLLPNDDMFIRIELKKLGWNPDKLFKKDFSKAYVDQNGVLQDFNLSEDELSTQDVNLADLVAA